MVESFERNAKETSRILSILKDAISNCQQIEKNITIAQRNANHARERAIQAQKDAIEKEKILKTMKDKLSSARKAVSQNQDTLNDLQSKKEKYHENYMKWRKLSRHSFTETKTLCTQFETTVSSSNSELSDVSRSDEPRRRNLRRRRQQISIQEYEKNFLKPMKKRLKTCFNPRRVLHDVAADGNCFFHAIVVQLKALKIHDHDDHAKLRRNLVNWLSNEDDVFKKVFGTMEEELKNNFIETLSKVGNYRLVTDKLIHALAIFLKHTIIVCSCVKCTNMHYRVFLPRTGELLDMEEKEKHLTRSANAIVLVHEPVKDHYQTTRIQRKRKRK